MRHHMDPFDRAIRHYQPIFLLKILPILRRALDRLFHQGRVFGMDPLKKELRRRLRRLIVLKDSKGFFRPDDLAGGGPPAEAPGMTEPLSFRQIGGASPLGAPACAENALCILQDDRPQQLVLLSLGDHRRPPRSSSASFVPTTRARILAKAVSRLVEVSSLKGENPQSSVVPSCSTGMYSAASMTRSRTSSGVSIRGSTGAVTPTKITWPGFTYLRMIFRAWRRS